VNTLLSSTGRTWMDRNLGATQVATNSTDYLAYGSLYQWCRAADGHQLIIWTSSSTGTAVNGTTATLSTTSIPGHSLFIVNSSFPNDWLSTQLTDGSLWWNGSVSGANSPCPGGFHVPTAAEWSAEASYIINTATAYSILKLTMSGVHLYTGSFMDVGIVGYYWSSTISGANASSMYITNSSSTATRFDWRVGGFSVRCIKD